MHCEICKRIYHEESAVDQDSANSFFSETWPAFMKKYVPCEILNAIETGFLFKACPACTLSLKGEKWSEGKCCKLCWW